MKRGHRKLLRRVVVGLALGLPVVSVIALLILRPGPRNPSIFDFAQGVPGDLLVSRSFEMDCAASQEERELEPCIYRFETNSLGFRGSEPDLDSGGPLLLMLGDGYSFGVALDGERTACDLVNQQALETPAGRALACVNGGAPGYSLADGRAQLEGRAGALEPDLVIWIVAPDDVWEMSRPVTIRSLVQCVDRNPLCGFRLIYHRYASDLFHPRSRALQAFPGEPELALSTMLDRYLAEARAVESLVKGWGGRLVFLTNVLPSPDAEQRRVVAALEAEGFTTIDLGEELGVEPGYTVDFHLDAATHRALATLLIRWWAVESADGAASAEATPPSENSPP
jgi:hypothetical protein